MQHEPTEEWTNRSLTVGEDKWIARPRGYSVGTYRLEVMLKKGKGPREQVGPVVQWSDDAAVLPAGKHGHTEHVRDGVRVLWRISDHEVSVTVDYEHLGRARIRATGGKLGEWVPNSALKQNVRRPTQNADG
jgi:hypothetical protein